MLIGAKIKEQSKDHNFPDPLIISIVRASAVRLRRGVISA